MQRYMWTNSPCWSWRLMRFDRRGGLMHKNPSRLKTSPLEPCNSHVELCRHLMRGQVVEYLPRVGWVPAHSRTATDKHATQQTESAENISQQSEKITLFFFFQQDFHTSVTDLVNPWISCQVVEARGCTVTISSWREGTRGQSVQ